MRFLAKHKCIKFWAISIIFSLVISLILAGCTTTQTETTATTTTTVAPPANPEVILATTSSTADTGLLDALIPMFKQKTGYEVKMISVGSGAAKQMGDRGEADVMLLHAKDYELDSINSGNGINRTLVMHNDFIIVGPPNDPVGIKGMSSSVDAFKKLAAAKALVLSRGTNSGTDLAESKIWAAAGINPVGQSWYIQSGQTMGASLQVASEKGAYCLADRGTYLKNQKVITLDILVQGDKAYLMNIYHVLQVNPAKWPKVNAAGAKAFVDFLVSPEVQKFISTFGVDKYGQPLFFPDAGKTEDQVLGGS
jgi:tungstate transport system substrate-binding protein